MRISPTPSSVIRAAGLTAGGSGDQRAPVEEAGVIMISKGMEYPGPGP